MVFRFKCYNLPFFRVVAVFEAGIEKGETPVSPS